MRTHQLQSVLTGDKIYFDALMDAYKNTKGAFKEMGYDNDDLNFESDESEETKQYKELMGNLIN